jgi:hypothetical protein
MIVHQREGVHLQPVALRQLRHRAQKPLPICVVQILYFWSAPSRAEIEQAEAKERTEGKQP